MEGALEPIGVRRQSRVMGPSGLFLMTALLFVLMSFVSVGPAQAAFSDVSGDEWFAQAVDELSAAGVVEGRVKDVLRKLIQLPDFFTLDVLVSGEAQEFGEAGLVHLARDYLRG